MDGIKGVILAGGLGTRLSPLTRVTNKHLLPIFNKPMIYYPIEKLISSGINEIIIVTGGKFAGDFLNLLGNGKEFGLRGLYYVYQEGEGGIAEALGLTEHFVKKDRVCIILGDNIFSGDIKSGIESFMNQPSGAKLFLKEVPDPHRFGVAVFDDNRNIIAVEEKPTQPKSNYAVTGIYLYDNDVFSMIKTLKPSNRGELEIADIDNIYSQRGDLTYDMLDGWWIDAGTFDSLLKANQLVANDWIEI